MKKITPDHVQKFFKENNYNWKKEYFSKETQGYVKAKKFYQLYSNKIETTTLKLYQGKHEHYVDFIINPREFIELDAHYEIQGSGCEYTVKKDMSSDWTNFLKKKGFKTEITLCEIPRNDLLKFANSTKPFIPKMFRDKEVSIAFLQEDKQYILFTFKCDETAYILCGSNDGEIVGCYHDSILLRKDNNISALWQNLIKEQTDVLLQAQI